MKRHRQYVCLLLQVILFVTNCLAENLILNVNLKKPIAVTSNAFLSFTLDPATLLQNADTLTKNIERSTNMARGLSPAYVRLGGPQSNSYIFERAYSHNADTNSSNILFETQWTLINHWAKNAGLNVIACIAPGYMKNESKTYSTDSTNITELLYFSDCMGYNVSWQLGYECQMRCKLSGGDLGRYVAEFREILKNFPRYSNSLIIGPDIVACRTTQQQKYLEDYLNSADGALSAITWHPEFADISLNNDSVSIHYDNIFVEKDQMYEIVSRTVGKKSLWIAESKPEKCKNQYLGALIWTRRLGNAAKLGIQVVMRQSSDLYKATPDYWVSLLHKTLVGREVLEMRQSNNESHVQFYSQCTKPSTLYEKGAITIFGINLMPRKVTASLKGLKINTLHKYILLPDSETGNEMFSEKVLLNNKPLNLINDEKLPDINPEIIIDPDGLELELSPGGIGFWVIPNAKVKACAYREEETIENITAYKLLKRYIIRQNNQEKREENANQKNLRNRKVYAKQDNTKQEKAENEKTNDEQKIWSTKLLTKIKKFLEKKVQRKERSNPLNLRRSLTIDFSEEQKSLSNETEEQQNLDAGNFEEADIKEKFKDIRDTLRKYKRTLLEKKAQAKVERDLKPEIRNIDNAVALISKIEILLELDEEKDLSSHIKIDSNESNLNEMKDEIKSKKIVVIDATKKLKEYLDELENSAETKINLIQKIKNYFNMLYNLLEDNESTRNNRNNHVLGRSSMKEKRFKRDLNKNSEDSNKIATFGKRSLRNDLTDYMIKRKMKQGNDHRKKLIPSNNFLKNFNNNKGKLHSLFQRGLAKRFLENDASAAKRTDYQHSMQEGKEMQRDDMYKKYSRINDMEDYQSSMQEPERTKRDAGKKLIEIGLRKHSRMDDTKDYMNERKPKRKDNSRREGFLVPFNPRTTDSEDGFYGFFRQDPIKGFPEGDVFVTTDDSSEQSNKDYDYVEDDSTATKKENIQYKPKSTLSHTEDDTWIEAEGDHYDYTPNEFFENIKLSNTRMKDSPRDYGDLWEAEFFPEENKNDKNNNNNNDTILAEVPQQQLPNEEEKKRAAKAEEGMSMQKLVNYYGNFEEQKQDTKYEALEHLSTPLDQFSQAAAYNSRRASNMEPEETKLKVEPESEASISFYQPSQVFAINYGNYQTSRQDKAKLREEKDFVNVLNRDDINAKTTQFSIPVGTHVEYPSNIFHNKRTKRSNSEKLRKILAEEMIKEDEENARDCHCRVIRASDTPKKLCYCRVKRDNQIFATQLPNFSSEAESINTDIAQSRRYVRKPMTKEEYEKIMAGEILPSTIESDYNEYDIMETVTTETSTLDHNPSNATQTIDVTSTLSIGNSEINNISEQYHDTKESTTKTLFVDSILEHSLSENNTVKYVTKETFFRTPSDVQSENKATAYDSPRNVSKISSDNSDNREEPIVSVIKNETTREKTGDFISKKEKTESSTYSAITDQKDKEWRDDNHKSGFNSTNSLEETTKRITEEQITTETILSKANEGINNSSSNESKTRPELLVDSVSEHSLNKNTTIEYVTKETFFRTQLPDVQSESKTTTYDSPQKVSKISSDNSDNQEEPVDYVIRNTQRTTREKTQDPISNKKKTDSSTCPAVTDQKDEEWRDDNHRRDLNSTNSLEEMTKRMTETTETILSKTATSKGINNSNESKTRLKLQRNAVDNQNNDSKTRTQFRKDTNTRGSKVIFQRLPRTPLRDFARHEEQLARRIEQIDKLKERLYTRREKLLRQYRDELTNIADEQKRNLNRRETWDKFRESYNSRQLIDGGEFIGVLVNDNVIYTHNNKRYIIPIGLPPTRHNNFIDQIYSLVKVKEIRSKDHPDVLSNNQFFRYLEGIEDDEEDDGEEADWKHNQDYCDPLKVEKDERKSAEASNHIIFVIDPSIYRGGEPSLQLYEVHFKDEKFTNHRDGEEDILDVEATEDIKEAEEIMVTENINTSKEEVLNAESSKDIATSEYKTEHLNNNREDVINNRTAETAEEINKLHNPNNETENNLNVAISNDNKTIENAEGVIDDDLEESELEKENTRTRRDIGKQTDEYLQRLSHFLAGKRANRDMYAYSKEDSGEIFSEPLIPFFLLRKKDRIPSNAILFPEQEKHSASSKKDFEINQQDEKKYTSSKYIVFIPINVEDIYEMLEIKDYDNPSFQRSEIPLKWRNQYLPRKLTGSVIGYLDNKSSEEFEYEDYSDMQNKNIENISDKENYTLESEQDSVNIKDGKKDCESRKKDEQYRIKSEEINKYLEMKDQIQSNEHEIFLLLPLKNEKRRQRRQIKNESNENKTQIKREVQSKPNKYIQAENLEDESNEYYLDKNNIDDEEEEEMTKKKNIETNYLQSQSDRRNHNNILEDFINVHKKNNLYNNKIPSSKNEKKNINLKTKILKNDKKSSSFPEKANPMLKNAIINNSERTQNLTESMEKFIDYSEEKFNEILTLDENHSRDNASGTISNAFHVAIVNIKKFFSLFSEISHIFTRNF